MNSLISNLTLNSKEIAQGLRRYIRQNPTDLHRHLIYADFLEENNKPRLAFARRKLAPSYTKAADVAEDMTSKALEAFVYTHRHLDGFDTHMEAVNLHDRASHHHYIASRRAYDMGDLTLALHHSLQSFWHHRAVESHKGQEYPTSNPTEFANRAGAMDHLDAAAWYTENHRPALTRLHRAAARILHRRGND